MPAITLPRLSLDLSYITEPVVDMRENPTLDSKVVSQTSLSEKVTIQEKNGDWVSITTPDGYVGWVRASCLISLSIPYEPNVKTSRLMAHIYSVKDTEYGPLMTVPYGSKLQVLDETDPRWLKIILPDGQGCYIQRGDVAFEKLPLLKQDLYEFSKKFLGLPYTWGGKTSFGFDCSGFVQMLYEQIGVHLLRDSRQQVLDDRFISIKMEELEPGDLIFFGKSEQKIFHVGMYMGEGQFIHSTVGENQPWVRISRLTDFAWSGHLGSNASFRLARQLKR